jgi:hypothetical protein
MTVKYTLLAAIIFSAFTLQSQVILSGEMKKWHRITLQVNGPMLSETSEPNPFMDYRLNVTFSHPESQSSYVVPGYFAADGNPAETSASEGNVWVTHFAPDQIGEWKYELHFRTGDDIAISTDPESGEALETNGETGFFVISQSDKSSRDLRSRGRLKYVGTRYLQFAEDASWFIKAGADAPENTLAYASFDDTPNKGGRRKTWAPHAMDYDSASAYSYLWARHEKGKNLCGAIKYLSDLGMNAISFLTFSLSGDDQNVFPHLLKVPLETYEGFSASAQWNQGVYHDRFDVSKLAQWERIFSYANPMGMYLHFKTMETENDQLMDQGKLGRERKLYYRELIARFGHHLALNWNLSEEISLASSDIRDIASYIKETDPYNHPVIFHTFPGDYDLYTPFYGPGQPVDGASMQVGNIQNVHKHILDQVQKSGQAGRAWIVANDEQGPPHIGVNRDPDDRAKIRREVIYGTLMAGGAGFEFYYGYGTGCTDLDCEDHRTRELKYQDALIALTLFQENLPFWEMSNANSLLNGNANYALTLPDSLYLVYLTAGGEDMIDLSEAEGAYSVNWMNPRNGNWTSDMSSPEIEGGVKRAIGPPPSEVGQDWIVLIQKRGQTVSVLSPESGNKSLTVYPNPGMDQLWMERTLSCALRIMDSSGQQIILIPEGLDPVTLQISNWPPGVYWVQPVLPNAKPVKVIIQSRGH